MSDWDRDDIQQAFIREFSAGDAQLSRPMGSDARRDIIRLEIYRHQRGDLPFFDSGMSYAQAFQKAYGRPIEMRLVPRAAIQQKSPIAAIADLADIGEIEEDPTYCHCGAIHGLEEIEWDVCDACGKKVR